MIRHEEAIPATGPEGFVPDREHELLSSYRLDDASSPKLSVALINYYGPSYGTGSGIILKRHFDRLKSAGHTVTVITPEYQKYDAPLIDTADAYFEIPNRRWFWPPFRQSIGVLYAIRVRLIARYVMANVSFDNVTHILSTPMGMYSEVARRVSKRLRIPLVIIHHDQEEIWSASPSSVARSVHRTRLALIDARIVLSVTEELPKTYGCAPEKIRLLRPIPGATVCRKIAANPPSADVVYAGSIFQFHFDFLVRICAILSEFGAILYIICDNDNPIVKSLQIEARNVKIVPLFKTNDEAIEFVSQKRASFLVLYSEKIEIQPWSRTSFPSKFVDFCRSFVPILIFSPEDTAIFKWCQDRAWPTFSSKYDEASLRKILSAIADPVQWNVLAAKTAELASGEFCPDVIQKELVDALYDAMN